MFYETRSKAFVKIKNVIRGRYNWILSLGESRGGEGGHRPLETAKMKEKEKERTKRKT